MGVMDTTTPVHVENGRLSFVANFLLLRSYCPRLSQPKGAARGVKCGKVKIPHPNSRKAAKMTKKYLRLQKINR